MWESSMLKHVFAAAAFAACLATSANAQDAPPPVDTMTCDQMNAEMMTAGMRMNAQLDSEGLAADAQAQQDAMNQARREGMVTGGAATAACMIPGMGYACVAAQQAQAARAQQQAAENQEVMNRQHARITDSMAGLDQNRLMAISDRHQQLQCETPQ
jgi:hypothetical protein